MKKSDEIREDRRKRVEADGSLCGEMNGLVELMKILREPGGCPWDRKQTHESLRPYLLEETFEVIDCIDEGRYDDLREELGDLLLQIVFHAQIAAEEGRFAVQDCIRSIREKLIERHPHIFEDIELNTADQVRDQWERIKLNNHKDSDDQPRSTLGGVPKSLPALTRAFRIQEKMAGVGFDWDDAVGAYRKLCEEVEEFGDAIATEKEEDIEEELGDILFSAVNTARLMGFGAEEALRKTTAKVIKRFTLMEHLIENDRKELTSLSLEEMDSFWERVKKNEKKTAPPE